MFSWIKSYAKLLIYSATSESPTILLPVMVGLRLIYYLSQETVGLAGEDEVKEMVKLFGEDTIKEIIDLDGEDGVEASQEVKKAKTLMEKVLQFDSL